MSEILLARFKKPKLDGIIQGYFSIRVSLLAFSADPVDWTILFWMCQ